MIGEINEIAQIPEGFSLSQISCKHRTGRAVLIRDGGKGQKEYRYRSGMMTELGDIREDVWVAAVEKYARENGDEALVDAYLKWTRDRTPWMKTEAARKTYALELYADRMCDNSSWAGYQDFADNYMPKGAGE